MRGLALGGSVLDEGAVQLCVWDGSRRGSSGQAGPFVGKRKGGTPYRDAEPACHLPFGMALCIYNGLMYIICRP